jgi:hypothetical protein
MQKVRSLFRGHLCDFDHRDRVHRRLHSIQVQAISSVSIYDYAKQHHLGVYKVRNQHDTSHLQELTSCCIRTGP